MKIIKKGMKTLPEDIAYIKKCKTCGCIFTYTLKDTYYSYISYTAEYIRCPQCQYSSVVPFFKKKYKEKDRK